MTRDPHPDPGPGLLSLDREPNQVSHNQLAHITGFGDHKATLYGVRIMRAIEEFVGRNPALRPLLRQKHQQVGGAWGGA